MTKNVACKWRLFNSGTATSRCTVLASSKVSDTAAEWSFHGSTRSLGVWAKPTPTNKLHTNTVTTGLAIDSGGEFHDGGGQLPCQQALAASLGNAANPCEAHPNLE